MQAAYSTMRYLFIQRDVEKAISTSCLISNIKNARLRENGSQAKLFCQK